MATHGVSRRRFFKNLLVVGGFLAAEAACPPASFAASALEKARSEGYIRIGFANEMPYGYATPDGRLTGESPEVAKAVFAAIGIAEVDGVLTDFNSLIRGLKAKRFDVIAAGMFINPQRCKEVAFSEPSYGIGQAILVKAGNPMRIVDYSSFANAKDLKLAVMAGAAEIGYAREAGVAESQLVVFPDQAALVAAVQAGRADGAALSALSIAEMAKANEGVEATKPFGEVAGKSVKGHGGFGFRKEDMDLRDAFDAQLRKFIGSPEHIALVSPFGFGRDYLPNKTMEQLCQGE